ncbi:MAG: hypothetical protein J0M10_11225 [Chitinophagales bacterium]|nr:hypothetical protein [Chitinophagales bacterium]
MILNSCGCGVFQYSGYYKHPNIILPIFRSNRIVCFESVLN